MPHLQIQHRTIYKYSRPVSFGRHRLVLRPREGHDVRVERMELAITPAHRISWTRDVFGNSVAIVDFTAPATELEISSNVLLHRSTPFPEPEPRDPWQVPYPVAYDPLETTIAAAYQALSYPEELDWVRSWLDRELPARESNDAEAMLFAVGALIHRQIKYRRRYEKGVQTPAQTLATGSGSCRDVATLLMEAARVLGVAARFVSGYLDCAASEAGRAVMHAWTEIYLPSLGWRGYDSTIGQPTALKHVVVGVSNHPRGVMPVSGMFTGASSDYQTMDVQVKIEKIEG
jgi:transglutaminase-like putative cysteine protease